MRTFYITGPETITYADLLNRVARKLGKRPKILPIPKFMARLAGWTLGATNYSAAIGTNFTEHLDKRQEPRQQFPFTLAPVNETLDRIFPMS
jgi:NAD dependent epimerase/dehydratase family enzyme